VNGLLQWVADVVKLLFKEDVVPAHAERFIHFLAPVLMMTPALMVYAFIPWGPETTFRVPGLGTIRTGLYATDVNVSLLLLVAITSVGVYGSSSAAGPRTRSTRFLGGLRSAAQLVSYEVPMGFASSPPS